MYCSNCGAEAQEGMAFCVKCGAPLKQSDASVQSAPQAAVPQAAAPRKKRIVPIVIAAICIAVIAAIVVVGCAIMKKGNEAQEIAHQKVVLGIQIEATGLDYVTSTPVPMQLQGTDFSGNSVSEEFLYDGNASSVPEVERGQYTISVLDSPISGEGTMYELANPSVAVSVTDYDVEEQLRELGHEELIGSVQAEGADTPVVSMEGSAIALAPLAPADVTNEMIDATCSTLERLGCDAATIAEHRQLVETRRDAARQELLAKQTTFSDERISLKVPASWGDHWTCDCRVMHSIQGGQVPNAWRYTFTNTASPAESFMLVAQYAGSYGDYDTWTEIPSPVSYNTFYIKNDGLSTSDFNAVVQSVTVK